MSDELRDVIEELCEAVDKLREACDPEDYYRYELLLDKARKLCQ